MKTVLTLLSTLLLSMSLSGEALAQSEGKRHHALHGFGHSGHSRMEMGHFFHELDLTAAQRDQLHEIFDRHHSGPAAEVARAFHEAQREAERVAHDPMTNESQVLESVRAAAVQAELLALEKHRLAIEVFEILNPEQQQRYREHLEEKPWTRGWRGDND